MPNQWKKLSRMLRGPMRELLYLVIVQWDGDVCMSTVAHSSILTSHAAVDETTTNVSSRRWMGRHSDCGQDDSPSSFRLLVFFSLFPHPVLCHCVRYSTHPWSQAFFIVSIGFVDCCAFPVDCTLSPLCWNGGLQFRVYISVVFFSSKDYLKRRREMEADSMTEIEHVGGKGRE